MCIIGVEKTFYLFCESMETGDLAQTTIAILEWSWDITDIIWNPFTSSEWFFWVIWNNPVWRWSALIIFFLRICALIWTIKDSNARSSSFWFQLLSALCVIILGPIFGLLLYIAIRPQWWKRDKTPRRDTLFQNIHVCENCWNFNQIDHAYCTCCGENLQTSCRECQQKYSKSYAYCPHCGAPRLEE